MKSSNKILRYERKYWIPRSSVEYLTRILPKLMLTDENAINEGYIVSSIYYDTRFDSALLEKLDGVRERRKFRVRCYNHDWSYSKFEVKEKIDEYISKASEILPSNLLDAISLDPGRHRRLTDYLESKEIIHPSYGFADFKPVCTVDYQRKAFYLPYDNIRVTIDSDLKSYGYCAKVEPYNFLRQKLFTENLAILEVKFKTALPKYLEKILANVPAKRSAISKYVLARKRAQVTRSHDEIVIAR